MMPLLVIAVTALDIALSTHLTIHGVLLWLPVLVITSLSQEQWVPMFLWLLAIIIVHWFIPFPFLLLVGMVLVAFASYWLRQRSFDAENFWLLGFVTSFMYAPFLLLAGLTTWSSFLTTFFWIVIVAILAYAWPVLRRSPYHAY